MIGQHGQTHPVLDGRVAGPITGLQVCDVCTTHHILIDNPAHKAARWHRFGLTHFLTHVFSLHIRTYALLAKDIDKTVGMFYFQAYDSVHGQWYVGLLDV